MVDTTTTHPVNIPASLKDHRIVMNPYTTGATAMHTFMAKTVIGILELVAVHIMRRYIV